MLQDIVNQADQYSNDDLLSQIGAQNFGHCNPQLFPETIQTLEVTSCPNGFYDENTSYAETTTYQDNSISTNISTPGTASNTSTISTAGTGTNVIDDVNLSLLFATTQKIQDNSTASLNFSTSPQFLVPPYLLDQQLQDVLDLSSMPPAIPPIDVMLGLPQYHVEPVVPLTVPPIPSVYEDDCLSSVSSFLPLNPSTPPPPFLSPAMREYVFRSRKTSLFIDNPAIFTTNLPKGPELYTPKLEYHGDDSMTICPDSMPRVFNAPELQVLGTENQPLAGGATVSNSLASEITSLDDPTLKVGKLTVEQKREKIRKYLKKRSQRNFSKKIKYACRKTLADNRPRVRGRFAKNDDYGEMHSSLTSNHEDDDGGEYIFDTEDRQSPDLDYY